MNDKIPYDDPETETRLARIARLSDEYDQRRIERWVALAKRLFDDRKDAGVPPPEFPVS